MLAKAQFMTEPHKQSWEKIRTRGRDRFLLRMIAKAIGVFLVGGAFIEFGLWLYLKHASQPALAMVGTWVGGGVFVGAVLGWHEWTKNEAGYTRSQENETLR